MEIVAGVHRIEDLNGSNAVLLTGEQMAVVDTGVPGNGEAIVSYIKGIGRDPADLRWILLTHLHHDHSGSAAELHELTLNTLVVDGLISLFAPPMTPPGPWTPAPMAASRTACG